MIAENGFCNRQKCKGTLVIKEPTGQGGMILGSSLVCDKCGYEKYPSPEYASCEQADQFLNAAVKLDGTPPFPATHNAFQACELYLRELGGFYYYIDGSDEGEFQSPSNKHSLSNLRNRLLKPRRDRLDVKHFDGQNFLCLATGVTRWPVAVFEVPGTSLSLSSRRRESRTLHRRRRPVACKWDRCIRGLDTDGPTTKGVRTGGI